MQKRRALIKRIFTSLNVFSDVAKKKKKNETCKPGNSRAPVIATMHKVRIYILLKTVKIRFLFYHANMI